MRREKAVWFAAPGGAQMASCELFKRSNALTRGQPHFPSAPKRRPANDIDLSWTPPRGESPAADESPSATNPGQFAVTFAGRI